MPKQVFASLAGLLLLLKAGFAEATDFSGKWEFNASKSQNVGMMAQAAVTSIISQKGNTLTVDDHSSFSGMTVDDHINYDLSGRPIQNRSQMSGAGTTRSVWQGDRLVTEWQNDGAVPNSVIARRESRFLSPDGKSMTIESTHTGEAPIVMVFDRSQ